jgi:hypothetical protein
VSFGRRRDVLKAEGAVLSSYRPVSIIVRVAIVLAGAVVVFPV